MNYNGQSVERKIPPKARENAGDQVVTDVGFVFGWLRERREFGPITEQS